MGIDSSQRLFVESDRTFQVAIVHQNYRLEGQATPFEVLIHDAAINGDRMIHTAKRFGEATLPESQRAEAVVVVGVLQGITRTPLKLGLSFGEVRLSSGQIGTDALSVGQ